jgi:glycerol-3-phosphate acyltransferase PlsY
VNFSIVLFKLFGKGDPRGQFSGNPGTVNVTRQMGRFWGAVVLIADVGRALLVAVLSETLLKSSMTVWVGFSLLIGNRYPLFHGFKGGKGVATYLGFTAALSPVFALLSCLSWVAVYAAVRIPFIGSFFMIAVMGLGIMQHYDWSIIALSGTVFSLSFILFAHRSNITGYLSARKGLTKTT